VTAGRMPLAMLGVAPGTFVRTWGTVRVMAERDGAAFLACCREHAAAGRWHGYFPVPSDLEGMMPAHDPGRCARETAGTGGRP